MPTTGYICKNRQRGYNTVDVTQSLLWWLELLHWLMQAPWRGRDLSEIQIQRVHGFHCVESCYVEITPWCRTLKVAITGVAGG